MHKTIAWKMNVIQYTILKAPNLFNLMCCVDIEMLAVRTCVVDTTQHHLVWDLVGSCSHENL